MSTEIKILVVDDSHSFRSAIVRSLRRKQYLVTEAPDGLAAKDILTRENFDLVLSDIQMPNFTGLDLLEWIKKEKPIPVILMTGFSRALETKKADEKGADDFLAKPFKDSDLQEVIRRHTAKLRGEDLSAEPAIANLENDFCRVSVEEFISANEANQDIYIHITGDKFIKIAHKGGKISEDRIASYKEKGINFVYVRKEEFSKIVNFNLVLARAIKGSDQIDLKKKRHFMKSTGSLILECAFVKGLDHQDLNEAKNFIETSMDLAAEDAEVFDVLNILSAHTDFLYAHSLGVSCFSIMIGRKLGWNSGPLLFRLGLGGLMHDIGKKEISKDILDKPRALLTQEERRNFESHTTRGKEILESLKSMPSEVVEIAYQHHEDPNGGGFPRAILKTDTHPLSVVVRVANIFCGYAIKSRSSQDIMTGPSAIETMEKMHKDTIDQVAFAALKKLFPETKS